MEAAQRPAGRLFRRYLAFLAALVGGTLLASALAEIYLPVSLVLRMGILLVVALVVAAFAGLPLGRGIAGLKEKVEVRSRELQEALDHQAATSEMLGIIGNSPTDLQPVFQAILASATRLCEANIAALFLYDGEFLTAAASHGATPEFAENLKNSRSRPGPETTTRRAALERRTVDAGDLLSVPMLREGALVGVITLWRREVRPFLEKQITAVEALAGLAVIATENVRLSQEVQARNRDLTEALEHQTAASEILRAISNSPTDLQPALEAVAENAARFCGAADAVILRVRGDVLQVDAAYGLIPVRPGSTMPIDRDSVTGRAVVEREAIHVHDLAAEADTEFPEAKAIVERPGHRTTLATPLLRQGGPIGALVIQRTEVRPFSEKQIALLKTLADQAVIAIENVRLFQELQAHNRDLTEALERRPAAGQVLRVISASPADLQPVLESLVENAARLCGAGSGILFRRDEDLFQPAVAYNVPADLRELLEGNPIGSGPGTVAGRVALERRPVHIPDVLAAPEGEFPEARRPASARAMLGVPMLRGGALTGVMVIWRTEPWPFSDKEVDLVTTFADQAAIAIENVRLFQELEGRNRELTEALEQQTATSEVLRAISSSPTDIQPVLAAVAENVARACHAFEAAILRAEGEVLRLVAHHGPVPATGVGEQVPIERDTVAGRAIMGRQTVHVHDLTAAADCPAGGAFGEGAGHRTALATPLVRAGTPIGALVICRMEIRPFTEQQIALLRSFADQAVTAMENVRLFQGLQERNRDLTEALAHHAATSEVLKVIGRSPCDLQPVLEALVENATRLCGADKGLISRLDGELYVPAAAYGTSDELRAALAGNPIRPGGGSLVGRAALERRPVHIPDVSGDSGEGWPDVQRLGKIRTALAVPILRGGVPVGVFSTYRGEVRPFTEKQIALLTTFADQAVIAMENARLFQALQARTRDLSEALEQQTATSQILRVISDSPTDLQPVLEAVVESAVRLCDARDVAIMGVDGNVLRIAAGRGPMFAAVSPEEALPINRASVIGRAVVERTTIHVHELAAESGEDHGGGRGGQERNGNRTMLATPLLREGNPVGAIIAVRTELKSFSDRQVALLKTFADQAVVAIENVALIQRLQARDRELTDALEQQAATTEVFKVISRSTLDLRPVLETLLENVTKLSGAHSGVIFRLEDDLLRMAAAYNVPPELSELAERNPIPPGRRSVVARVALERQVVHVPDVLADPEYERLEAQRLGGHRTLLGVPMFREAGLVGVMLIRRTEVLPFTDKQIELVTTFADQAAIAIENVRLLEQLQGRNRELSEALEQQAATSELLKVMSRPTVDLQSVLEALVGKAAGLCGADRGCIHRLDGDLYWTAVAYNPTPELKESVERHPIRPGRESAAGRAALERRPVHIPDVRTDPEYGSGGAELAGARTLLAVPMLREGTPIGIIEFWREAVRPFTERQIALVTTFAEQAVVTIENARLHQELQGRVRELARSVEELKTLEEGSQAVSSTLDLHTVLTTVVARAVQLSGTDGGVIYEYDEETQEFLLRASHRMEERLIAALKAKPIRLSEGAMGQAAAMREPIQVPDVRVGPYEEPVRDLTTLSGFRALLAVPLLREDRIVGGLVVRRKTPGEFPPQVVGLLRTFAAQSVLAIENARLFREIDEKCRQLEADGPHRSEFLASMSHELRAPLNAIISSAEVLLERMFGEMNKKQTEYLENIHSCGRHLVSLLNDILDLSKVEVGRMDLDLSAFDLPQTLESALTLVRERAARRGIALDLVVDERLGSFLGDVRKIRQVLLELLSNAVKFTPEAGRIWVAAKMADGTVEISVSDTGIGIAREDQEAIFEGFRRGRTVSLRRPGETGLALARKFVELHGGKIWVESEVGRGATFTFTLPVSSWREGSS